MPAQTVCSLWPKLPASYGPTRPTTTSKPDPVAPIACRPPRPLGCENLCLRRILSRIHQSAGSETITPSRKVGSLRA